MATFEKRVRAKGKTTWRVRVRRQGGSWLSKSFAKKSDAEAWSRNIEHRMDNGEILPSSNARKHTLADAVDRYLDVVLPRAARNKNARDQKRLLTWWKAQLGNRSLSSISSATIAEIRDQLAAKQSRLGAPMSGGTINRHLASLSAVMKVAVKEFGWIPKNPVSNVSKMAESKGRERFLKDAERDRLLKACDGSECAALPAFVRLALATGARKGELLGLQWSNVDLVNRRVRFVDTKNGESRTVPLAASAIGTLKAWKADRLPVGSVFPKIQWAIDPAWRKARSEANLEDVRFHDLRHSAASYLAMSGASMIDIAAILGHRTLAMVKRYSHLSEQHTTAAIDRMAEKFLS